MYINSYKVMIVSNLGVLNTNDSSHRYYNAFMGTVHAIMALCALVDESLSGFRSDIRRELIS